MASFKDLYLQGKASRTMLDDFVDEWHMQSSVEDESLVEFLGFDNLEEYDKVIKDSRLV